MGRTVEPVTELEDVELTGELQAVGETLDELVDSKERLLMTEEDGEDTVRGDTANRTFGETILCSEIMSCAVEPVTRLESVEPAEELQAADDRLDEMVDSEEPPPVAEEHEEDIADGDTGNRGPDSVPTSHFQSSFPSSSTMLG